MKNYEIHLNRFFISSCIFYFQEISYRDKKLKTKHIHVYDKKKVNNLAEDLPFIDKLHKCDGYKTYI